MYGAATMRQYCLHCEGQGPPRVRSPPVIPLSLYKQHNSVFHLHSPQDHALQSSLEPTPARADSCALNGIVGCID